MRSKGSRERTVQCLVLIQDQLEPASDQTRLTSTPHVDAPIRPPPLQLFIGRLSLITSPSPECRQRTAIPFLIRQCRQMASIEWTLSDH